MKTSNDWKAKRLEAEQKAKDLKPQVQATKKTLDATQESLNAMLKQGRALHSEGRTAHLFETNFKNVEDKIKTAASAKAPVLKRDVFLKHMGRTLAFAGTALAMLSVAGIVGATVASVSAISGIVVGTTTLLAGAISWAQGKKSRASTTALTFKETSKVKGKTHVQTMASTRRDLHIFETARSLTDEINSKFSRQPNVADAIKTRIKECVAETGAKSISLDQALKMAAPKN